jgi:deazaflavin-dependent oxidoreductase (nitroreductase family)
VTGYGPSPVDWVREEVEHYERTGTAADGRSIVVLTTIGARSGLTRKTPLMRVASRGVYAVIASQGGRSNHPHWYANVLADPHVLLQDGLVRRPYVAREVTGRERTRWWNIACVAFPSYADYQSKTSRRIPVIVLDPVT